MVHQDRHSAVSHVRRHAPWLSMPVLVDQSCTARVASSTALECFRQRSEPVFRHHGVRSLSGTSGCSFRPGGIALSKRPCGGGSPRSWSFARVYKTMGEPQQSVECAADSPLTGHFRKDRAEAAGARPTTIYFEAYIDTGLALRSWPFYTRPSSAPTIWLRPTASLNRLLSNSYYPPRWRILESLGEA